MQFVSRMLSGRCTRLKFDDFLSDWVPIDNGIGQGDPLSMILYLFYNADLLEVATGKGQAAVAYVDDANLYAEGDTYKEAYRSIREMLLKEGGAKEWTQTHQSWFKKSKFAMVGFSCCRVQDPAWPGKTIHEPRPSFTYEDVAILPSTEHNCQDMLSLIVAS